MHKEYTLEKMIAIWSDGIHIYGVCVCEVYLPQLAYILFVRIGQSYSEFLK